MIVFKLYTIPHRPALLNWKRGFQVQAIPLVLNIPQNVQDHRRTDFRGSTADSCRPSISINGPESWYENPWVWVYEFKKL